VGIVGYGINKTNEEGTEATLHGYVHCVDGMPVFRVSFGERDSDWMDVPSGWLTENLDIPEFVGGITTVDVSLTVRLGKARTRYGGEAKTDEEHQA
jgi:hypothetical protein